MIFAYRHAFAQLRDPRYRRLLWIGMALSLALLVGLAAIAFLIIQILVPGALFLPVVGRVQDVSAGFSVGTMLYLPWLSVFLMVPVASIFTGLYLDDVADAVEAEHYRGQEPRNRIPWREAARDSLSYFGILVAVNLLGMAVFAISSGWGIAILWALNGFLLSREYFTMIARRRNDAATAASLFQRDFYWLWLPGLLLAIGLSIPILNLAMPLVGAAVFTHMYHRLHPAQVSDAG
ncbi:EI24 domain-containing protein [Natronohydrobacter thiooxidans]|jgi:CysZ protein|uniref:EI24 domain-containing protein n=1 Tax=Natronohydrobacter thiooxidans TaxID=87172 RepID=UPI0008FF321B|nr:EI24 domain-containing protein [Natronohydrobacter thiooxidans]